MPRADLREPVAAPSIPDPGPSFDWPAQPPRRALRAEDRIHLFTPSVNVFDAASLIAAPNVGTAKGQFSSSRVIPLEALNTYPWSAVGKVFFTAADGKEYECSAAVIAPRIILTAGHCVHEGKNGATGFVQSLEFHPGFHLGDTIGVWEASFVITSTEWTKSGGKVPNVADYAVVELVDNELGRVGDVVGWLGVLTKKLRTRNETTSSCPNFSIQRP